MLTVAVLVAVFFLASTLRAAVGFGDALVAMPLLTMAIGLQVAAPVVAIVALVTSAAILLRSWRHVSMQEAWPLIAGGALGLPIGLVLLSRAPESAMKIVLGILIALFGAARPLLPGLELRRGGRAPAGVAGFVGGVLGGAYNMNGPPVVVYGALRRWPVERFRATLQSYFLPSSAMIAVGHALAGLWSRDVLILSGIAMPAMLAGIAFGRRLSGRLRADRFELTISILLVVLGATLIAQTLLRP
jgi:uncharacterized membrane protein YfcA